MPGPAITWTPAKSEIVRRMWLDGHSATAIATALGVSRDSVLGRARRMRLSMEGREPAPMAPKPPKVAVAREKQRLPAMSSLWELPDADRRHEMTRRAARAALATRLQFEEAS